MYKLSFYSPNFWSPGFPGVMAYSHKPLDLIQNFWDAVKRRNIDPFTVTQETLRYNIIFNNKMGDLIALIEEGEY